MSLLTNTISPRHYTIRTLQLVTTSLYGVAALSVLLGGWLFFRVGLQWAAVAKGSKQLAQQKSVSMRLTQDLRIAELDLQKNGSNFVWISGLPDLAARIEDGAQAYGVQLQALTPETGETNAEAAESPYEGLSLTSQKLVIRAAGPYNQTLAWIKWLAGPRYPLKIESISVAPAHTATQSGLAVEMSVKFYRQKQESKS